MQITIYSYEIRRLLYRLLNVSELKLSTMNWVCNILILFISNFINYFFYEDLALFASITGATIGFITVFMIPIILDITYHNRKIEANKAISYHWSEIIAFKYDRIEIKGQNFSIESLQKNVQPSDKGQFEDHHRFKVLIWSTLQILKRLLIFGLGLGSLIFQFYHVF